MPEYLFRPKARADIEEIWNYTCKVWGTAQARHYVEKIRDVCSHLAINPDLGKMRDELYPGLRVYSLGKHLIFYLRISNGIDIVRILHEHMDSRLHLP
jgi:toxin ParE1/3/4